MSGTWGESPGGGKEKVESGERNDEDNDDVGDDVGVRDDEEEEEDDDDHDDYDDQEDDADDEDKEEGEASSELKIHNEIFLKFLGMRWRG